MAQALGWVSASPVPLSSGLWPVVLRSRMTSAGLSLSVPVPWKSSYVKFEAKCKFSPSVALLHFFSGVERKFRVFCGRFLRATRA